MRAARAPPRGPPPRHRAPALLLALCTACACAAAANDVDAIQHSRIPDSLTRISTELGEASRIMWQMQLESTKRGEEFDVLLAMSLHNTTWPGVQKVSTGLDPFKMAFEFKGDPRELQVPQEPFLRAVDLLRNSPEFTVLVTLRQDKGNAGTILSFSHGCGRYLELQSSGRRNEVRLHYVTAMAEVAHTETFPFHLADDAWHRIALTVSGNQAQLLVDCHPIYRRTMPLPDRNFTLPQLTLWLGQRNSKHSLFKGTLQDVKIISGPHGYLSQCPGLDSECPTCGQFSLLQTQVLKLTDLVGDVTQQMVDINERLNKKEECDCQKSCVINGTIHPDGTTWLKDCNKCSCVHGEISCRPLDCKPTPCANPVLLPGKCCRSCLRGCYFKDVEYDHGQSITLSHDSCSVCKCNDGVMDCSKLDPQKVCPPLKCSPSQQIVVAGECCKFCPGVDYCSQGHNCNENATCMNLNTKYACQCNQGFKGNGVVCEDVDECASEGGLWGHHCHLHTHCTNVVGSYVCDCNEGYARVDKFNCIEIDECASGDHQCSPLAYCNNTAGSYACQCKQGYHGDGKTCKPTCSKGCLNGGTCVSPERCECSPGFTGQHCERDLDECSTNTHHCPASASCVNMPGWYYCKCKSGFRSVLVPDSLSTTCQDIDECKEGLHSCHETAQCQNMDGGYRCECSHPECKLSCMQNGKEVDDGWHWIDQCQNCNCEKGVLTCSPAPCNCSPHPAAVAASKIPRLSPACCPQCDPANDCRHQELHHVVFHSGEKWVYQCQTCECLLGEIDCWELECPMGENSIGERACCGAGSKVTGSHNIIEALCSPNSTAPCPQAAHHTAPDCQECSSICVNLLGGDGAETSEAGHPSQTPRREGTATPLEPG